MISHRTLKYCQYGLLGLLASLLLAACAPSVSVEPAPIERDATLHILWDKGYVIEEDEAIQAAVENWQAQTGHAVDLSFYSSGEIAPKTLRASRAGTQPDILFAAKSVYPISDWQGKLADVTDIVAPVSDRFTPEALQAAHVYGAAAGDRYYAVPLSQSIIQIHYWKDLLAQAGYTPADIPQDWDAFWAFWQTAQDRLRAQGNDAIYAIGFPYSVPAKDSYQLFEQTLVAYDVQLLDAAGNLQVDRPEVRSGIIDCLNWYTQFYRDGYAPPNATEWHDPDNNRNLLDRNVLMTPNPTMSIPAAVRNDPDTYLNQLGTLPWPNQPNGEPLPHLIETRLAIVLAESPHPEQAKAFLSYLIQPAVANEFLKTSYGRYIPSISALRTDPFWQDPADPHLPVTASIVISGNTRPTPKALNPAYGVVMEENVWGAVLHEMVTRNLSAEAAADRAIAEIKQIFADWS
ncbi:MAG: carbohydrate ABC transporter substrate-binding protein [Leptolyngbya sp. SIO4C1]|nr:carbohydrate ABC transporter substrate-binding protein [Leptolyngbya sp. SIO4C1]